MLENIAGLTGVPGNYLLSTLAARPLTDLAGNHLIGKPASRWAYSSILGSGADDTFVFKTDPDGLHVDVWANQPIDGAPTFVILANSPIALHGNGGNDTVTIDESTGDIFPLFSVIDSTVPSSQGSIALKLIGTPGDDTLKIDSENRVLFGTKSITIDDLSSIEFFGDGGDDSIRHDGTVPVTINYGD